MPVVEDRRIYGWYWKNQDVEHEVKWATAGRNYTACDLLVTMTSPLRYERDLPTVTCLTCLTA